MKIFLVPEGRSGDDVFGYALTEEGNVVKSWMSSSVDYLHHDLGERHIAEYRAKFGAVELVPLLPGETTSEFAAAAANGVARGVLKVAP